MSGVFNRVYEIVQAIPKGNVLTYGLISNLLEGKLSAQAVGWALKALPAEGEPTKKKKEDGLVYNSSTVPWHRVINSKGMISTHKRPEIRPGLQKKLLQKEGVKFDREEKIDLSRYLWKEAGAYFGD